MEGSLSRMPPGNPGRDKEEFTRDLLHTSNNLLSRNPVDAGRIDSRRARRPEIVPPAEVSAASASATGIQQRRRRNLHRHQQRRARRYQHHKPEEASEIQRLYGRYSRKALRKVLQEDSPFYSGGWERLDRYVAATYHRTDLKAENVAEARRLYKNCNWEHPTQDEMVLLESFPTRDEIQRRLRKITKTSPGQDRIEWRHLKAVDPTGDLLTTVLGAVHALGIPSSWRKSRTNHKNSNDPPLAPGGTEGLSAGGPWNPRTHLPPPDGHRRSEESWRGPVHRLVGFDQRLWIHPAPRSAQLFRSLPIPVNLRETLTDIYTDNRQPVGVCQRRGTSGSPHSGGSSTREWPLDSHFQPGIGAPRQSGQGRPGERSVRPTDTSDGLRRRKCGSRP
ncbi:reverse transcriptase [Plakobranchus ocellatus]|uniref:Reverse transcriptase n=1 Tax=Plakobranchus ocellatus TaxID=259542 RepID=A0AAV3ZZZ6_9GAST|nr:reverse transcriptase [Plakobranchus ocellatus]